MGQTQIVICGSIAIDRIMNFSGKYVDLIEPAKLDVVSISVLVDSLKIANGGNGGNISYSLAKLGEKPILLGSVGQDAEPYISQLKGLGIDTSGVHFSSIATASFNVLTDASENQIGGFYPGAMSDSDSLIFDLDGQNPEDRLFCISPHDPKGMARQVKECQDKGLRLFYDPGQQVLNLPAEDLKQGVLSAELVIVNEYELDALSKKTGLSLDELVAKLPVIVITHGSSGSVIRGTKCPTPIQVGVAKPESIVDPTGAGDAFRAGFLYGYLRQWELGTCAELGAVLASFVLEQAGTQVELSKQSIVDRYLKTFNKEVTL